MTNGNGTTNGNGLPGAIPWYQSPVYIGAVVTIVTTLASVAPKLATELGLTSADAISHFVQTILGSVALVSGLFTAWKRGTSSVQPITMTKAAAQNHPVTLASQQPAPAPDTPAPVAVANEPASTKPQNTPEKSA